MHFSAKRGIAIACRLSVCLSVTLVNCDHMQCESKKPHPAACGFLTFFEKRLRFLHTYYTYLR